MRITMAMCLSLTMCAPVLAQPATKPSAGDFALGEREKIVFVGDSITAAGQYVMYIEGYLVTRFPQRTFDVLNVGRGSETLSNLSEVDHPGRRPCLFTRFDADVADFAPTVVVSCYGINDGIYHPFSEERFKHYQEGVRQLITKVRRDLKARLLLLTPPIYDSRNPGQPDVRPEETYGYKRPFADYDKVLGKYAAWLMTLKEEGVTVGDLHAPMALHLKTRRQDTPTFRMSGDTIHPSSTGHLLMAMAALKAWHAPALVDEARIDAAGKQATAGEVKDLQIQDGAIRFSWTAKVPMPMDGSWDANSLALERFTETLNRHRLTVAGLTGARYTLLADDVEVGQFSRQELAAGIDLTALQKFPTTARSQQILPLLRDRRKCGYAVFRKNYSGGADPKRAALDERLQALCKPASMAIRIAPTP
jgi:lysophospholipase L1-like esterase